MSKTDKGIPPSNYCPITWLNPCISSPSTIISGVETGEWNRLKQIIKYPHISSLYAIGNGLASKPSWLFSLIWLSKKNMLMMWSSKMSRNSQILFFKIQPNKADRFFCLLLFVQSFNCLYLWNQFSFSGIARVFPGGQLAHLEGQNEENK